MRVLEANPCVPFFCNPYLRFMILNVGTAPVAALGWWVW